MTGKLHPFLLTFLIAILLHSELLAQHKTENLFLITLDGFRWQELFGGADSNLIRNPEFVRDTGYLIEKFWRKTAEQRRETLMPFFWRSMAEKGQIYGNRHYDNHVNCTNIFLFSYPGYAEILCGYSDAQNIRSNQKINNPNKTFLELLHETKQYRGRVAAFGSWDVFPYIINESRSGIPVNAGFEKATGNRLSKEEKTLNRLQDEIPSPWSSVRLDAFTHHYAKVYIRKHHPRVVYIAYGETDDFAHDGRYDHYLQSARQTDQFIEDLWNMVQRSGFYRGKTTMIITTDHGRGTYEGGEWRNHGSKVEGAGNIWLAVIGPDTPALGEVKVPLQLWQNQIAASCMKILQANFQPAMEAGPPVQGITRPGK